MATSGTSGAVEQMHGEKTRVTMISIGAAVVLTALKLAVGLLTGSLGMLSEAAHSGLDLVASVITFASVRIAERPADRDHPYGHGRVENLSATLQGLLLLATAGWIVYESVVRLFVHPVPVDTTPWAFVVMGSSIAIDFWRSRMLLAAARKFHSAALEADALNFRADMYSSSVVIVGLALTLVGERLTAVPWLAKADAAAALVVAVMIIRLSGGLAARAIGVLLDRAPEDLAHRMTEAVTAVPGVVGSHEVRLRESGNRLFADVVVTTGRTTSLAEAHELTERIEAAMRAIEPRTETLVHVEPMRTDTESAAERIRAVALRLGVSTHHDQVYRVDDGDSSASGEEAQRRVTVVLISKRRFTWRWRQNSHSATRTPWRSAWSTRSGAITRRSRGWTRTLKWRRPHRYRVTASRPTWHTSGSRRFSPSSAVWNSARSVTKCACTGPTVAGDRAMGGAPSSTATLPPSFPCARSTGGRSGSRWHCASGFRSWSMRSFRQSR